MKKSRNDNPIFVSATLVTALSVAERGLGFLYRIALSRLIGAEGLGLYQVALSLFALFLTIGAGGLPVTVSRMISKSKAEHNPLGENYAVSSGITLSLLLTLPVCLFLIPFGEKLPFLFSDERVFPVFRILLIGLCFSSIYAVLRGSFWGNKRFLLSSVLEISEEAVMVIAGVLLLQNVTSPSMGAERAALAAVLSYLFSFTAAFVCFFFVGGRFSSPKKLLKPTFNATLPITSVRACGSLINSAIAIVLPAMLIRAGYSGSDALTLFGVVSGMVLPILFIPATLIGAIALVLTPELSEAFYRKDEERLQKNIRRGLRLSFLVACILLPFFFVLGGDLGHLAFGNTIAGEMIVKSCPILLPMSLTMISTSILNSMGYEKQTLIFYFIGEGVALLSILLLPSVCGIYAYTIGLFCSFLLTGACNLIFLYKKRPFFQKRGDGLWQKEILLPLILLLPITILGQFFHAVFLRFLSPFPCILLTSLLLALATFSLYLLLGLAPVNALRALPFGKRKKRSRS